MPGIGELIEGAMQHAPHPALHSIETIPRGLETGNYAADVQFFQPK
jgi:hypothetical protein